MAKFLNKLFVTEINDVVFRVVYHPFRFQSDLFPEVIEAPVGFFTDFASMFRWVPMLYAWLGNIAHEPAVIHDWLYYSAITSRIMSDKVLLEAMKVCGLSSWRYYPIYWGVRMGGWSAWKDHRQKGHSQVEFYDSHLNVSSPSR